MKKELSKFILNLSLIAVPSFCLAYNNDLGEIYKEIIGNNSISINIEDGDANEALINDDVCQIKINKKEDAKLRDFVILHELTHCHIGTGFMRKGEPPANLSYQSIEAYKRLEALNIISTQENVTTVIHPGIVYHELLADSYSAYILKRMQPDFDFKKLIQKRNKDLGSNLYQTQYISAPILNDIAKGKYKNLNELQQDIKKVYEKYLELMDKSIN